MREVCVYRMKLFLKLLRSGLYVLIFLFVQLGYLCPEMLCREKCCVVKNIYPLLIVMSK